MSDGQLYLDAKVALDGARNLTAAGLHFQDEYFRTGTAIAAASSTRPWGGDDIGQSFDKNYGPIEDQVLQAWYRLSQYIQGLGDAAAASVADNQGADQEAAARVTHSYRDRP